MLVRAQAASNWREGLWKGAEEAIIGVSIIVSVCLTVRVLMNRKNTNEPIMFHHS